jgi:hypothetical protein
MEGDYSRTVQSLLRSTDEVSTLQPHAHGRSSNPLKLSLHLQKMRIIELSGLNNVLEGTRNKMKCSTAVRQQFLLLLLATVTHSSYSTLLSSGQPTCINQPA